MKFSRRKAAGMSIEQHERRNQNLDTNNSICLNKNQINYEKTSFNRHSCLKINAFRLITITKKKIRAKARIQNFGSALNRSVLCGFPMLIYFFANVAETKNFVRKMEINTRRHAIEVELVDGVKKYLNNLHSLPIIV